MKIYKNISEISFNNKRAITIGVFDGVHLGHREILRRLKQEAATKKLNTLVITFEPHPRQYFQKNTNFGLLTTIDERLGLLESEGVDEVIVMKFDADLANLSYYDFAVNTILKKIGCSSFVLGYNNSFGKDGEGNYDSLSKIQNSEDDCNFNLIRVDEIKGGHNERISSSLLRNMLNTDNIEHINEMLGYDYFITGEVIKGNQIGQDIGFPTANIRVPAIKLLPKNGVYFCIANVSKQQFIGVANIGKRPTIEDNGERTLEVHLLDFNDNIYGLNLRLMFKKFHREEQKFSSITMLTEKIKQDVLSCRNYFTSIV